MQTSAKQIDQATIDKIEQQFYKAIAHFKNTQDLKAFLTAFLSETEISVMSKRFAILKMFAEGKSYAAIEDALKVSSATVSTVSKLTQEPAISSLMKDIAADEWADVMSAKFMNSFSFLKKKEQKTEPTQPETAAIITPATQEPVELAADEQTTIQTTATPAIENTQTA